MGRKRVSTRFVASKIKEYYDGEVSGVTVPPVPRYDALIDRVPGDRPAAAAVKNPRPGFYLFRAAAAAVLIACGAGMYAMHNPQNELAEMVGHISEQEALDEKVTSGLQRAGNFIYENL